MVCVGKKKLCKYHLSLNCFIAGPVGDDYLWWNISFVCFAKKRVSGPFSRPRGGGGGGGCAIISEAEARSEEAASPSSLKAASHAAVASSIVAAAVVISQISVRHLRGASNVVATRLHQGRTHDVMRVPSSYFELA